MSVDSPQIQAIKARYRASFPEKLGLIAELQEQVLEQSADQADFVPIREELHKLAGSSGMYGYDDISLVCRAGMKNADDGDSAALGATLTELTQLLEKHA